MEYKYRIAKKSDLEILTELRKDVLIAANKLDCNQDMTDVRKKTSEYYKENLVSDNHFAIIATDEGKIIATGAVSFYSVMPTFHNTTGRKTYIMNML